MIEVCLRGGRWQLAAAFRNLNFFLLLQALMLNSKARGKSTAGEMVNLMSVDAQRLMELMAYINSLWSSPLQIAGAIYFLYNTLGISVLAGVGVLILIIPVNMLFGSKWHSLQVTIIIIIYCILYKILPSLLQIVCKKSASSSWGRNKLWWNKLISSSC